jgi:hypothetical protein
MLTTREKEDKTLNTNFKGLVQSGYKGGKVVLLIRPW